MKISTASVAITVAMIIAGPFESGLAQSKMADDGLDIAKARQSSGTRESANAAEGRSQAASTAPSGRPPARSEVRGGDRAAPVSRLDSARHAVQRGETERAMHEYRTSIEEDIKTADAAIRELVDVYLGAARACAAESRPVDASRALSECDRILQELRTRDAAVKQCSEPVRIALFDGLARVKSACREAAARHVANADRLRREAKGRHWWNFDDETKQAAALHEVNLAWAYRPYADERTVAAMYDISANMKSELPGWQYKQTLERDRLLGPAVGDHQ